jgi:hypothetical protein
LEETKPMLWIHHQNASRDRRDAAEDGKTTKATRAEADGSDEAGNKSEGANASTDRSKYNE